MDACMLLEAWFPFTFVVGSVQIVRCHPCNLFDRRHREHEHEYAYGFVSLPFHPIKDGMAFLTLYFLS